MSGLLFFSACQQPPVAEYEVIPQPREISYTPGFFKMSDRPVIAFSRDLNNEARLLQAALARDFSINATLKEDKKGDINLVLDTTVLPDKPEGYRLEVTSGKVNIRASSPAGILNGIDVDSYNSETDKAIFANYSAQDIEPKKKCKEELQKMFNLPVKPDTPMIAIISRLVAHKGLDLVRTVIEEVLRQDVQIVILGKGDSAYENYFSDLARKYVGKLVTIIAFNPDLSRKIYSGADLFLMPSKSEPCGLSQMIASRYGTVPIVRETGGLYDSIKPVGNGGNGFTFANYNAYDMLYVIREAINCYHNKEFWPELVKRVMNVDFSWQRSAKEYEKVYGEMLK